jgi:hypothetical protein
MAKPKGFFPYPPKVQYRNIILADKHPNMLPGIHALLEGEAEAFYGGR